MSHTAVLAFAVLFVPATSVAGGIYVPGVGPHAQARAGAFVARADDATALAHNPAGFARQHGTSLYLGANLVRFDQSYTRAGSYEPAPEEVLPYAGQPYPKVTDNGASNLGLGGFAPIPLLAFATDLGKPHSKFRFGGGVFAPHGAGSHDFDEHVELPDGTLAPAPQRYDVVRQSGLIAFPSVAAAYTVTSSLSVGARLSWGIASIETTRVGWAVRNYDEYTEKDGVVEATASDPFIPSLGIGLIYQAYRWLELGAAYSSPSNIHAKGTQKTTLGSAVPSSISIVPVPDEFARCAAGGTPERLKSCADVTLPQTATIGARWIGRSRGGAEFADIELDVRWEDWSAGANAVSVTDAENAGVRLNEVVIRHGFRDTFSFRLGGSYTLPAAGQRLTMRAGAAYDTAAAPLSWTRLDMDGKSRVTLTTGVAYELGRFRVDVGGGVVLEGDRNVPNTCQPPDGPTVTSEGCDGTGEQTPVLERESPDPSSPLQGPLNQYQSPYNAGLYESGYYLLSLGLSTRF
jgi:long-subunit fatty acid transport protein